MPAGIMLPSVSGIWLLMISETFKERVALASRWIGKG
jgi:hypothetical protein